MMHIRVFGDHREWEDWLSMVFGVLTALSPWISGQTGSEAIIFNTIVVGVIAFVLGEFKAADLHRRQEDGEIALGSWLGASPFIFGYSTDGVLRFWHFVLAAAIVIPAVAELWQDWNLSNEELAEHDK